MKELLQEKIAKYKKYVANLEWHLKVNNPLGDERKYLLVRIGDFLEIINDLTTILNEGHKR